MALVQKRSLIDLDTEEILTPSPKRQRICDLEDDEIYIFKDSSKKREATLSDDEIDVFIKDLRLEETGLQFVPSTSIDFAILRVDRGDHDAKKNTEHGSDKTPVLFYKDMGLNSIPVQKNMIIIVHGPNPYGCVEENNHWSLMYIDIDTNKSYHFDSMYGYNRLKANRIAYELKRNLIIDTENKLINTHMPQQMGSWECGYYVLWVCEMIKKLKHVPTLQEFQQNEKIFYNILDNFNAL